MLSWAVGLEGPEEKLQVQALQQYTHVSSNLGADKALMLMLTAPQEASIRGVSLRMHFVLCTLNDGRTK